MLSRTSAPTGSHFPERGPRKRNSKTSRPGVNLQTHLCVVRKMKTLFGSKLSQQESGCDLNEEHWHLGLFKWLGRWGTLSYYEQVARALEKAQRQNGISATHDADIRGLVGGTSYDVCTSYRGGHRVVSTKTDTRMWRYSYGGLPIPQLHLVTTNFRRARMYSNSNATHCSAYPCLAILSKLMHYGPSLPIRFTVKTRVRRRMSNS